MAEDLNLPASLERLEINPERNDCSKIEQNPFHLPTLRNDPECVLQSLSLKADCPKGSCQCNKKKDRDSGLKRVMFKRPILRRSKLNALVLRAPVLRIKEPCIPSLPDDKVSCSDQSQTETVCPISRGNCLTELVRSNESRGGKARETSASSSSCSVQARISPPSDDTTIDELASYFDLLVHIPKKMSLMAEMMYI